MNEHLEAAIEAGVKAVDDIDPLNAVRTPHIKAAIIAALPHIRAMIAEEIRARKSAGYNTQQREWNDAIEHAAQIAEGNQQ